jgi:uncharacterized protein (TIGR02246 family)
MPTYPSFAAALILCAGLTIPAASQEKADETTPDEKAVHEAVAHWFVALNAMFEGDPEPFAELYSHADDVTYMSAEGTYRVGWTATYADWKDQAAKSLGGEVHGEEVHVVVEGTMATATHFTRGTVKTPDGKTIDQRVRETSVFRKEDGAWKMIGHQADNYPVWVDVVDR